MVRQLLDYTREHRRLIDNVKGRAGFVDPVLVNLAEYEEPLLKGARKGGVLPIDDALVRDWNPVYNRHDARVWFGMRICDADGVRFVHLQLVDGEYCHSRGPSLVAVERRDYRRLYRAAIRRRRDQEPPSAAPVMTPEHAEVLWRNTIAFLESGNLSRIKDYGGRAKRGILLLGPPGNGKTMACRWIWEECRRRRWQWRLVTPDAYRNARGDVGAMEALFSVDPRGVVFFDDMDIALRDRETVGETDDQAVFLGALDGLQVREGVVFVFTSNCRPELIDPAFRRPGRIDLVLNFSAPDEDLRRQLIARWHADILRAIPAAEIVDSTAGRTFAEIEELKNLLIMRHVDAGEWDWDWAVDQFTTNRRELSLGRGRLGFKPEWSRN